MRCAGREDEEGREREGEKRRGRETEEYKIVSKREGVRHRSRKDDVAKWNKSKSMTKERQKKGKFSSKVERNSLYAGRRRRWQSSVLRIYSLHGLLLKISQNSSIFHTLKGIIESQECKEKANTPIFFLSSSLNYLVSTIKCHLIILASFTQALNIGGNSH